MGKCTKLRDLLDAMVDWSQWFKIHKTKSSQAMSTLPSLLQILPKCFPIRIVKENACALCFFKTQTCYVLQNLHAFCTIWFMPKTGRARHFLHNNKLKFFRGEENMQGWTRFGWERNTISTLGINLSILRYFHQILSC